MPCRCPAGPPRLRCWRRPAIGHLHRVYYYTPGDLYRHGGWIVVIVGMAVLGWLMRLLDDSLDVRSSPHAILGALLVLPALVMAEQD